MKTCLYKFFILNSFFFFLSGQLGAQKSLASIKCAFERCEPTISQKNSTFSYSCISQTFQNKKKLRLHYFGMIEGAGGRAQTFQTFARKRLPRLIDDSLVQDLKEQGFTGNCLKPMSNGLKLTKRQFLLSYPSPLSNSRLRSFKEVGIPDVTAAVLLLIEDEATGFYYLNINEQATIALYLDDQLFTFKNSALPIVSEAVVLFASHDVWSLIEPECLMKLLRQYIVGFYQVESLGGDVPEELFLKKLHEKSEAQLQQICVDLIEVLCHVQTERFPRKKDFSLSLMILHINPRSRGAFE